MKALIALLCVVAAVLSWEAKTQRDVAIRLQQRLATVQAKLAAKSSAESLDSQERCARQAAAVAKEVNPAEYQNHYNRKMNKCFLQVFTITPVKDKTLWSYVLIDAFERKDYAEYSAVLEDSPPRRRGRTDTAPQRASTSPSSGISWRSEDNDKYSVPPNHLSHRGPGRLGITSGINRPPAGQKRGERYRFA